jgi:hypothetical protein
MFISEATHPAEEESRIVYTLPRNEGEEIHFTLRKYKGRYYIDLRLWFQQEGETEFAPTKKGISLPAERLPELKEGLNQLGLAMSKVQEWEKKVPEKPAVKFPPKRQDSKPWQKRPQG